MGPRRLWISALAVGIGSAGLLTGLGGCHRRGSRKRVRAGNEAQVSPVARAAGRRGPQQQLRARPASAGKRVTSQASKRSVSNMVWSGVPYYPDGDWSGPAVLMGRKHGLRICGGIPGAIVGRDGTLYDNRLVKVGRLPGEPSYVSPKLVLLRDQGPGKEGGLVRWDLRRGRTLWANPRLDSLFMCSDRQAELRFSYLHLNAPILEAGRIPPSDKSKWNLAAFRAEDGHLLWTYPVPRMDVEQPTTNGKFVLVFQPFGLRMAINLRTGRLVWDKNDRVRIPAGGPACSLTLTMVGAMATAEVFDLATGQLLPAWRSKLEAVQKVAHGWCLGGTFYGRVLEPVDVIERGGAMHTGELLARKLVTGATIWKVRICEPHWRVSDMLISDSYLALACWNAKTGTGRLVIVDRGSGRKLSETTIPKPEGRGEVDGFGILPIGDRMLGLIRATWVRGEDSKYETLVYQFGSAGK